MVAGEILMADLLILTDYAKNMKYKSNCYIWTKTSMLLPNKMLMNIINHPVLVMIHDSNFYLIIKFS